MATQPNEQDKERSASLEAIVRTPGLFTGTSETYRHTVAGILGDAYDATWETIAPFYVGAVHRMLGDIREAAESGARFASVGRDGENCREIVLAFMPALDIVQIPLNRSIVHHAVLDLKDNHGRSFPALDAMFASLQWKPGLSEDTTNAARNLTALLRRLNLPVDDPDPKQDIVLLDNGLRGTARAALKEMYWPDARGTLVRGLYLFRAAAYGDPHPYADRGYVFHLDALTSDGGRNLFSLPDDPDMQGLTFRADMALFLIEELTSGPELTPHLIDADGYPVTSLYRDEPVRLRGNPQARYLDPRIHEGVLRAIRAAIRDHARYAARCEQDGADVQRLMRPGYERMVQNTRNWIAGDLDAMHPGLRELADTYCR